MTLRRYQRVRSRGGDYDNPGLWRIYSGLDRLLLIPFRSLRGSRMRVADICGGRHGRCRWFRSPAPRVAFA